MGVISGYSDDTSAASDDKQLTLDNSNQVKLTPNSVLKDYILADGNVTTAKIADEAVTNAKLSIASGELGTYTSYTPTWTNVSVGNGTVSARYTKTGPIVKGRILFTLGSTSSVSGIVTFSLPVTAATTAYSNNDSAIGMGTLRSSQLYPLLVNPVTSTTARLVYLTSSAVYAGTSSSTPATWATGNVMSVSFEYEAA